MADQRHLANAPIREALIDIQIGSTVSMEKLDLISSKLTNKNHKKEIIWQASVGFEMNKDGPNPLSNRTAIGYRYTFEDEPYVLLCRERGFTFSHLAPYSDWETLSSKALDFWKIYSEIAKPTNITRLAVRYINNILLPVPILDFGEYFTSPPIMPEELPQSLASFLQRYVAVDAENGNIAVITQALEEAQPNSSKISFLFDIDVFRTYENLEANDDQVWEILGNLRTFKNDIFFKFLTEKTVELFE